MAEVKVCSFPPGAMLHLLQQRFDKDGIRYRLIEREERIDLFAEDQYLPRITRILDEYTAPEEASKARATQSLSQPPAVGSIAWQLRRFPVTFVLIALSVLGFCIVQFRLQSFDLFPYFTFTRVYPTFSGYQSESFLESYLQHWQWWRAMTPAFLHFGIAHLVFNCVAALEFGRRLEMGVSRSIFILLFVFLAVGSNSAQFFITQSALFGGLSGVVYGFFGALSALYWRFRLPPFKLPIGFSIMMLIPLVLGPLGVFEAAFGIAIANHAHMGGLLLGGVLGFFMPCEIRKP